MLDLFKAVFLYAAVKIWPLLELLGNLELMIVITAIFQFIVKVSQLSKAAQIYLFLLSFVHNMRNLDNSSQQLIYSLGTVTGHKFIILLKNKEKFTILWINSQPTKPRLIGNELSNKQILKWRIKLNRLYLSFKGLYLFNKCNNLNNRNESWSYSHNKCQNKTNLFLIGFKPINCFFFELQRLK